MSNKNRAFIFDMDGVLIDSENAWIPYQDQFSTTLFGKDIYNKIGSTIGISINEIYKKAQQQGFSLNIEEYYRIYDEQAKLIYTNARPTPNVDKLINHLKSKGFKLGLISSSRRNWIDMALRRLNIENDFDFILSLNDRKELKSKPHKDGYIEAIKYLHATSKTTIVLEDSNAGIQSAKSSGAFTIGFKEHLLPKYVQTGADIYVANMLEVIKVVDKVLTEFGKI
ncbi:HAD family phosphatase [Candidatus Microgenomates bacterium]|nr:HAD family phosphatase [Candidatus Microgenomates bacterium]